MKIDDNFILIRFLFLASIITVGIIVISQDYRLDKLEANKADRICNNQTQSFIVNNIEVANNFTGDIKLIRCDAEGCLWEITRERCEIK